MQADVTTTATRYLGTIHVFIMLNPITDTPAARVAIAQASHIHKEVKIIIFIIIIFTNTNLQLFLNLYNELIVYYILVNKK
jgi:hypothetical protein